MMMITMNKMKKSIKTMVLTGAVVTLMMSLAAPAAMAQMEVREMDHSGGSSNGSSSTHAEEPLKDPGIELSDIIPTDVQEEDTANEDSVTHDSSSSVEEEGRLKDSGIELGDITPTDVREEDTTDGDSGTHDPGSSVEGEEDRIKDSGIRLCDITPTDCQNPDDSQNDKNNEQNDKEKYLEYCNYPSFVYDPACDKNNEHNNNKDSDGSQDYDQGSNSGARLGAKDPNPGEEEESKDKEESSAPGDAKAGEQVPMGTTKSTPENDASDPKEAVSASDEAGQIANSEANSSPTVRACHFNYDYQEGSDRCFPSAEDLDVLPILTGEKPWPDSFGGYLTVPVNFLFGDLPQIAGWGAQALLGHAVGDTLVGYGEDVGGPLGWPIQGLGYTIGTVADTAGVFLQAAGQVVGAVNDVAEKAVDTVVDNVVTPVLGGVVEGVEAVVESVEKVADVAKSTWKKISSWF